MPVFHQHRLLFIHIPKNAGRSIEEALLKGDGTPDSGRRNLINRGATWLRRKSESRHPTEYQIGSLDYTFASQHLTYNEMSHLRLVPDQVLKSYPSFCVCRNPYDRAVSTVLHFAKETNSIAPQTAAEFEHHLIAWKERPKSDHNLIAHDRSQSDYILDDRGKIAVEHILRFESLGTEYEALMERLNIPSPSLTHFGKATRAREYTHYFTPHSRRLIEEKFGEDIERFQYAFDQNNVS